MVDFHGTLKGSKENKESLLLRVVLIRKLLGFLSGFNFFVRYVNAKLEPNEKLILKLNEIANNSRNRIFVVSAASLCSWDEMKKELDMIGLKYNHLILRENVWEPHTEYKVRIAKKINADVIVEDCPHYGIALKRAIPTAQVRCPNWNSILN